MWAYAVGIFFPSAMNGILLVCLIPAQSNAKVILTFNLYDVLPPIFVQDTNNITFGCVNKTLHSLCLFVHSIAH